MDMSERERELYIYIYPPTPADSRGSASEKQLPATSVMQCEEGAREDRMGSYLQRQMQETGRGKGGAGLVEEVGEEVRSKK